MNNKTVILSCSSLKEYVEEAQRKCGTDFPVIYVSKVYHRDPEEMRSHIQNALASLPDHTELVLVSMGFCGGSWDKVKVPCKTVIPKIDDCVSLLLQTTDTAVSNLKADGHLYVRSKNPKEESFHRIFQHLTEGLDDATKERYHNDWKKLYSNIDIMDTGLNDCHRKDYEETVREDAEWLEADLSFVKSGTYMLEKLFSGKWDHQFLILDRDHVSLREDILI